MLNENKIIFDDAKTQIASDHLKTASIIFCKKTAIKILRDNRIEPNSLTIEDLITSLKKNGLTALASLEFACIKPILMMQTKGMPFDKALWQEHLHILQEDFNKQKQELRKILAASEDGFKLFGSGKDEKTLFTLKKELDDFAKKNLNDAIVTDKANKIFAYLKKTNKILDTYGQSFLQNVTSGRLKGIFNCIGTKTGRLSSQNANMQSLPTYEPFQKCIKPSSDKYDIWHFDFKSFEMRVLAALCGDEKLLTILKEDGDVHSLVATKIFNKSVSKDKNTHLRERAKVLNFALMYGMGNNGICKKLNITTIEASKLIDAYFKAFNKIYDFLQQLETKAKDKGYVNTLLGRKYFFDDDNKEKSKTLARNFPIQGTGAEIAKLALINIHKNVLLKEYDCSLINMVHDEFIFEISKKDTKEVINEVIKSMNDPFFTLFNMTHNCATYEKHVTF